MRERERRFLQGMNGTYGDYIYVNYAVETIMQHNASAAPLFYYLAYARL